MSHIHMQINEVAVCALPIGHPEFDTYAVQVVRHGDVFEVAHGSTSYGHHDYHSALDRAGELAPTITVDSRTAAGVLADSEVPS